MDIKLFRAISASKFQAGKVHRRYNTQRPPSNIPYVVDNILEFLRPDDMPNRRFCAYANLTPEQALKNANPPKNSEGPLKAYQLHFQGSHIKIANLATDAREHPSIKALQTLVQKKLDVIIQSTDWAEKSRIAPLFFPCLTKQEISSLCQTSPLITELLTEAAQISTFWADAVFDPQQTAVDGELFFELASADACYTLSE